MNQAEKKDIQPDYVLDAIFSSSNIYQNLLYDDFEKFKLFKKNIRFKLISKNIILRNNIKKERYISKNSTKINKKNNLKNVFFTDEITINNLQENNNSKNNVLNSINGTINLNIGIDYDNEIKIPRGIFYYPLEKVVRTDDIHILNYIPFFSNLDRFEKVIEKTFPFLDDWFDEIPHNLDDCEKIYNQEFIIWIFFKGIKIISQKLEKIENFNREFFVNLLTIFSNIIGKNSSTIFKISQIFLKNILNKKNNKSNLTPFEDIKNNYSKKTINKKFNFQSNYDGENEINIEISNESSSENNKFFDINFIKKETNKKNNFISLEKENIILSFQKFIIERENVLSLNKLNFNCINEINTKRSIIVDNNLDVEKYKICSIQKNYKISKNKKQKIQINSLKKNLKNIRKKQNEKNVSGNTPLKRMEFYREAYCQICFLYYCPYHFKREYKFYDYEYHNITLHKRYLKRLITNISIRNGLDLTIKDEITNKANFIYNEEQKNSKNKIILNNGIYNNKKKSNKSNFIKTANIMQSKEKLKRLNRSEKLDLNIRKIPHHKQIIETYKLNVNEYKPCLHHDGVCTFENCLCIKIRGSCEKFCSCRGYCKNEYPGCNCPNRCDSNCPCLINMRECDPDICKCFHNDFQNLVNSKDDVNLNISTKKNKEKVNKHINKDICKNINNEKRNLIFDCGNSSIFLNKTKKTSISQSLVAENYGLFAMEVIEKNEFICEYIGELLSKEETDRRSVFNDQLGLNYFFKLNNGYDIDAYRIGNEMR